MRDIRSTVIKQFMRRLAETSVQDIIDFWKIRQAQASTPEEKKSWEVSPAGIIKWMVEELGVPREKADDMMQEYSKGLADRGHEALTKKREQEAKKLREHVERTKTEIENPSSAPLPQLPGMERGSAYKLKISTVARTRSFQKKYSTQDPKSSSFSEKVDILLDYVENFPSAQAAASSLLGEAKKLLDMLSNHGAQVATASLAKQALSVSGVVAKISNFLWLLTALALYGAAGTSDYIAKHGSGEGLSEAKAFLVFLTSLSASILSSVLYKFIMDRKTKSVKQKSLYEGFNK